MTTRYLLSNKPLTFDKVPKELVEIHPIEDTLRILGFDDESKFGNPKKSWGPLEVEAGPWVGGWLLIFSTEWRSERVLPVPYESLIPLNERPIVVLSIVHEAWHSWFDWMDTPDDLRLGKEFGERNWKEQLQEYLCRPTIWADREFFRFCVSYLDKFTDWPEEDTRVELSYADGQLKLKIKNKEVYCPARGKFAGRLTLSARQFFRYLSKRFIGDTVLIQVIEEEKVIIGSRLLPRQMRAQWFAGSPVSK
jgi:hypothetical protein